MREVRFARIVLAEPLINRFHQEARCRWTVRTGFKEGVSFVKRPLQDLESRLLFAASCTCIAGTVQPVRPISVPGWVGVFTLGMIGEIFALLCSDNGPHPVAKLAVLSVCFGTQGAAILNGTGRFAPSAICGLFCVSFAGSALGKFLRKRRESMSSIVQAVSDSSPQITSGETEPFKLPMMPIRDMVVYPGLTTPFVVGRELSLGALDTPSRMTARYFLQLSTTPAMKSQRYWISHNLVAFQGSAETLRWPTGMSKSL